MPKHDIGELIAALNEAVNKLNNLRTKHDDLEKENARLREAINAALTEETPMEDGLWSQEPIGPNETPAEAINRLIKFRVDTGCIVKRDALQAENARLREALDELLRCTEKHVFGDECKAQRNKARAALGEKE